jgi:PAS domain-containing protein
VNCERQVNIPGQDQSHKFDQLRVQAEELLEQHTGDTYLPRTDILDLIHELRIHQAELQIQNEELQRAQHELSKLHQEYTKLYEFAPCGYLTLNNKGIITRINLTGTRLLESNRQLIHQNGFSQFIDLDWDGIFASARLKSAQTGEKQSLELPL